MSVLSFFHTLANSALNVLTNDIEPALLNLLKSFSHDIAAQIVPIATAELTTVEDAAISAASTGDWAGFGTAVGTATTATITKSVGVIENAGVNDAIVAVNAAIASHTGIQAAIATGQALVPAPAPATTATPAA